MLIRRRKHGGRAEQHDDVLDRRVRPAESALRLPAREARQPRKPGDTVEPSAREPAAGQAAEAQGIGPGAPIMVCMVGTSPAAATPASVSSQGRADRTAPRPAAILNCSSRVRPAVRMAEASVPTASVETRENEGVGAPRGASSSSRSSPPGEWWPVDTGAGQGVSRARSTERLADDRRRRRVAEDRAPRRSRSPSSQTRRPRVASRTSRDPVGRCPDASMRARRPARSATAPVSSAGPESSSSGSVRLSVRMITGAFAGDRLLAEDVAGRVHSLDHESRVVEQVMRHGDGELSVGQRHRLRQGGAGAGVRHAEPYGSSRAAACPEAAPSR